MIYIDMTCNALLQTNSFAQFVTACLIIVSFIHGQVKGIVSASYLTISLTHELGDIQLIPREFVLQLFLSHTEMIPT